MKKRKKYLTIDQLEFGEIYYLHYGFKDYYQGRLQKRTQDSLNWVDITFKTYNGSISQSGYGVANNKYRPANKKEKFTLWIKGQLPKSIFHNPNRVVNDYYTY